MHKLLEFIKSIEMEINCILANLRNAANEVSEVYISLNNVSKLFEFEYISIVDSKKNSAIYAKSLNVNLQQFIKNLDPMIMQVENSLTRTLALSGVRLDEVRTRVINEKTEYEHTESSYELFFALDNFISEVDKLCISLAANLKYFSDYANYLRTS